MEEDFDKLMSFSRDL